MFKTKKADKADLKITLKGDFDDGIDADAFFGIFGNLTTAMRQIGDNIQKPAKIIIKGMKPVPSGIDVSLDVESKEINTKNKNSTNKCFKSTKNSLKADAPLEKKCTEQGREGEFVEETQ